VAGTDVSDDGGAVGVPSTTVVTPGSATVVAVEGSRCAVRKAVVKSALVSPWDGSRWSNGSSGEGVRCSKAR
jgi:hypothetical protein